MDGVSVKYRELIRQLRRISKQHGAGLEFVRGGSNHEVWSIAGERLVIPRHREINERTAREIIRTVEEVAQREHD